MSASVDTLALLRGTSKPLYTDGTPRITSAIQVRQFADSQQHLTQVTIVLSHTTLSSLAFIFVGLYSDFLVVNTTECQACYTAHYAILVWLGQPILMPFYFTPPTALSAPFWRKLSIVPWVNIVSPMAISLCTLCHPVLQLVVGSHCDFIVTTRCYGEQPLLATSDSFWVNSSGFFPQFAFVWVRVFFPAGPVQKINQTTPEGCLRVCCITCCTSTVLSCASDLCSLAHAPESTGNYTARFL